MYKNYSGIFVAEILKTCARIERNFCVEKLLDVYHTVVMTCIVPATIETDYYSSFGFEVN